jgi:hypothetical protein
MVVDYRLIDTEKWAQTQFGNAKLGHKRRTKRLVKLATQIALDSMASLPNQTESWADLKGAYRFFDTGAVTFEAVAQSHWEFTRDCGPGRKLIIDDTTELDFGCTIQVTGLGPVGGGYSKGFLLHNAMMIDAETRQVLGLAGQDLFLRKPAPKKETRAERRKRDRESQVWGRVIEAIGPPPPGAQFVHVMDRGADDFEVFCRAQRQQCDWVGRLKTLHRVVLDGEGEERRIDEILDETKPACEYSIDLRARPGKSARTARVEVTYARITMPVPRQPADSLKELDPEPIEGWVVQVREVGAPKGVEPLHWVLFTSLEVESVEAAIEVVEIYEARWVIEEFHKALKSGCNIERRQLKKGARLAPLIAMMSVVAVRLLQLKFEARANPDRPTEEIVPKRYVDLLERCRKLAPGSLVRVRDFFRTLAKLGGFLGRKGDGEPGWLTIWRGWEKLHGMIRGAALMAELKT